MELLNNNQDNIFDIILNDNPLITGFSFYSSRVGELEDEYIHIPDLNDVLGYIEFTDSENYDKKYDLITHFRYDGRSDFYDMGNRDFSPRKIRLKDMSITRERATGGRQNRTRFLNEINDTKLELLNTQEMPLIVYMLGVCLANFMANKSKIENEYVFDADVMQTSFFLNDITRLEDRVTPAKRKQVAETILWDRYKSKQIDLVQYAGDILYFKHPNEGPIPEKTKSEIVSRVEEHFKFDWCVSWDDMRLPEENKFTKPAPQHKIKNFHARESNKSFMSRQNPRFRR